MKNNSESQKIEYNPIESNTMKHHEQFRLVCTQCNDDLSGFEQDLNQLELYQ